MRTGQAVGTVHVHPSGRFVYLANRASSTTDFEGKPVFVGGENNIAVYAIDQDTGEPTLIQNIDTRGMHPRTFALDFVRTYDVDAGDSRSPLWKGGRLAALRSALS